MPEIEIRFKYDFTKLHGQTSAKLIYCQPFQMYNDEYSLCDDARQYDTDGKMDLKYGDYLQLVFIGNKQIPFTTYRKFNLENYEKYMNHIGYDFDLVVDAAKGCPHNEP